MCLTVWHCHERNFPSKCFLRAVVANTQLKTTLDFQPSVVHSLVLILPSCNVCPPPAPCVARSNIITSSVSCATPTAPLITRALTTALCLFYVACTNLCFTSTFANFRLTRAPSTPGPLRRFPAIARPAPARASHKMTPSSSASTPYWTRGRRPSPARTPIYSSP